MALAPAALSPTRSSQTVEGPPVPLKVSVVVPVTERCDSLVDLYRTHREIVSGLVASAEFLFVLDGGFEREAESLHQLMAQGEPIRVIALPRHFGEATALMVGCHAAQEDLIVTLPAYFQTQPEGVRTVLAKLQEGYDLVVARRYPRQDPWPNRLQNHLFHRLIRALTNVSFHDMSCGLRGFHKRVLQEVRLYGDLHRFLPLMAYQRGFRVIEVDVPQHPLDCHLRVHRLGVYLRRLLDILTVVFLFKFTKKPLRFFGLVGAGLFAAGFFISLVLAIEKLLGATALADRPLLILGVLLMVLGVQTGSIGLLGEMIIFTHARKLKDYAIDRVLRR
ncbi:MAG: glycosyltransferase [Nitrospirae bacterium]|nr:MAG: glycosyltransferase [Nitrospirota bacterium]